MRQVHGPKAAVPLSPAISTEDYVFVSGQVPDSFEDDIGAQTAQVLDKVEALLREAGTSLSNVVKATVFITDRADFQGMNEVYARYFPVDPPTRSTVCVGLVVGAKVEIEVVARRG